ncbi:MAG: hypothetical protein IKD43_02355 [Clostridia bacterium]|nr:hypothetical protein [Clostridia bacterium]
MKFRRNIKEEKLFRWVAIGGIVLIVMLLIAYFITRNADLFDLIVPALFVPPLFFFMSYMLKKSFVEFKENQIIFVNGNGRDFKINISDIEALLIPSPKALKNKFKDNSIVIVRQEIKNIISYSMEIEKYIKENIKVDIVYYDDYRQAIK